MFLLAVQDQEVVRLRQSRHFDQFQPVPPTRDWLPGTKTKNPWENNAENGQLSVFDSVPIDPHYEGATSIAKPPLQLQIRRWCHGEVRISLTPRMRDDRLLPHNRRAYTGPVTVESESGIEEIAKRKRKRGESTLVKRPEFQDDKSLMSGYGQLPKRSRLTRYAARELEECSEIAKRHCGRKGACFTGTLPGSTALSFYTVACHSGYLLLLLRQWFRDRIVERFHLFGVWEPQYRGALHFHIVVMSNDVNGLASCMAEFHSYWRKLLLDLSASTKVDLFEKNETWSWINDPSKPRTDAQWLRKDPAKYLGKYVGKEAANSISAASFCPSRWITVDRPTVREAIAERVRVALGGWDLALFRQLFDNLIELAEPLSDTFFFYLNKIIWSDKTYVLSFQGGDRDDFWFMLQRAIALFRENK